MTIELTYLRWHSLICFQHTSMKYDVLDQILRIKLNQYVFGKSTPLSIPPYTIFSRNLQPPIIITPLPVIGHWRISYMLFL